MAPRKKLRCGIGAQCWVYIKYMHPQKVVREFYKNYTSRDRMNDLLVIGREVKTVKGNLKMCVLFRHSSFENVTLYCTKQYAGHVVKEGDEAGIFDQVGDLQHPTEEVPEQADEEGRSDGDDIPEGIFNLSGANSEDISHVRNLGFTVDDDNDPAPENIPDNQPLPNTNQTWGCTGMDYRAQANVMNVNPNLEHRLSDLQPDLDSLTLASLFMTFFPTNFLFDVILKATNKTLNGEQKEITKGELLRFIGIWLFMATTSGFPRRDYFSKREVNVFSGAPYRVHVWMTKNRFECILRCLSFTLSPSPLFKDRFWEIREVISAWNSNMTKVFKSGWITCLDESMSVWMNKYTCPGWMFVPRKPKPFGNEYHSICCGLSGVMFAIELVEGKDRPKELPSPPKTKKTSQLLLNLCASLAGSGKIVVLDSGFCVLQALVALKAIGVFAHAVIKKRRYWPKFVPGDLIEERMKEKAVGEVDGLKGVLDGEPYNIFAMKDVYYSMKLMSTYGNLTVEDGAKKQQDLMVKRSISFITPNALLTTLNIGTWSTTTITSVTLVHPLKKHGRLIDGRIGSLHFFSPSQKSTFTYG